jgi:hypothetical protein
MLEDRNLPSTFTVNHLADDVVGSGLNGSLRYAITHAADNDTITFDVTGTINLTGALPDLTHGVSIQGPGANLLTVRRDTGGNYRIFRVGSGTTVSISGLKVANGYVVFGDGGGIANSGTLTVNNCDVSGSSFDGNGGAIRNDGILTVTNATITGGAETGGAIYTNGMLTLTNATVSGSYGFYGGGILNNGTMAISHSIIAGNTAECILGCPVQGGGIFNHGALTITDSTFSGNQAISAGWNEYYPDGLAQGGGIYNDTSGTLTISDCTFSGNYVHAANNGFGSAFAYGGGIDNEGQPLTISNSTFSGNRVVAGGAPEAALGGGIFGDATISNSTFSGNYADAHSDIDSEGGGIFGTFHMRNTIIAGNHAGTSPDLSGNLGSQGYNLIGNTQGGTGFDPTDLLNANPLLGPLHDNGGPTQTMALLAGSPALNAGDPAQLGVADQRGVVRSGGVNIGAYQASASAFVVTVSGTVASGTPFDVTVQAVDVFGQVAFGYRGTVTFSVTDPDPAVVLPADYTFTADDQGTHTFTGEFTLITPGMWTLTTAHLAYGLTQDVMLTVDT